MKNFFKYFILIFLIIYSCTIFANNKIFEATIILKDHKFDPEILEVPENIKIRLTIHNQDSTIEEFDSIDLKREKIIPGNSTIHIIIAPLKAGKYDYIGEFHSETAKGSIMVTEKKSDDV